ncbi:MAG: nucleoside-diphosphate kinase [Chloroflexi bacterium]|nr:MAG: nucleoside-diphosphate kinase [Chloroflexota bacterium]
MEQTLVIVKPDGVQRGLTGEILKRLEQRGLKFIGLKMIRIDRALAEQHYGIHKGKGFYESLVSYITSGPVVVAVVEGPSAVAAVRTTVGKTNPAEADAGTIRGDFAVSIGRNLIHASDSPENAVKEINLFFSAAERLAWDRSADAWILED